MADAAGVRLFLTVFLTKLPSLFLTVYECVDAADVRLSLTVILVEHENIPRRTADATYGKYGTRQGRLLY